MKKIEKEVVVLLEQILEEKIGNLIKIVLIKPRQGVSPKNYMNRGFYIYQLVDLPLLLEKSGVLKITDKKENDFPRPLKTVMGIIDREKAGELIAAFKSKVIFPPGRDCIYENQTLFIKLKDGSSYPTNFSSAEKSRKVFEAFWTLWKVSGTKSYSRDEIVKNYKKIHNETIEHRGIAVTISNIRGTFIEGKPLQSRITWKYDNKTQAWIFQILPLN
ncbi:hypothetical protein ACFL0F_01965 [Patescibacteria group bacterium]